MTGGKKVLQSSQRASSRGLGKEALHSGTAKMACKRKGKHKHGDLILLEKLEAGLQHNDNVVKNAKGRVTALSPGGGRKLRCVLKLALVYQEGGRMISRQREGEILRTKNSKPTSQRALLRSQGASEE